MHFVGKTTKTEKVAQISCTGAVRELGQFVQCQKQNAPFRTIIFCPQSHLFRPNKADLEDAMMELTDIDINEDNLDFSQVKNVSDHQRNFDCQQDYPVPQVCQIAARFQDEGDERQVEFSNSN